MLILVPNPRTYSCLPFLQTWATARESHFHSGLTSAIRSAVSNTQTALTLNETKQTNKNKKHPNPETGNTRNRLL